MARGFIPLKRSTKQTVRQPIEVTACYCTLALGHAYRTRAKALCKDLHPSRVKVFTDRVDDFSSLPVEATYYEPEGPMAEEFLASRTPTGFNEGAVAYHDKRVIIRETIQTADIAIYVDADCRLRAWPAIDIHAAGISALPAIRHSIAQHLSVSGQWREPFFARLAQVLGQDASVLRVAAWVPEWFLVMVRCSKLETFFEYWDRAARFCKSENFHYGEGGVIGLAAMASGIEVDFESLAPLKKYVDHEGGGPKAE